MATGVMRRVCAFCKLHSIARVGGRGRATEHQKGGILGDNLLQGLKKNVWLLLPCCDLPIPDVAPTAAVWCPCTWLLLLQQQCCGTAFAARSQTPWGGHHFGASTKLLPGSNTWLVPHTPPSYITDAGTAIVEVGFFPHTLTQELTSNELMPSLSESVYTRLLMCFN